MPNIIFDLDGTLADTAPDILRSIRRAFELHGLKLKKPLTYRIVGPPLEAMIRSLSPAASQKIVQAVVSQTRGLYRTSGFPRTRLMPDAISTLKFLKRGRHSLYVVTNKPQEFAKKILQNLKISRYFLKIVAADMKNGKNLSKLEMLQFLVSRAKLIPAKTILVSDNLADIKAASTAKIKSVAFLRGYAKARDLLMLKPDYAIKDLSELRNIL